MSQSSRDLQDRIVTADLGQVQLIPVRYYPPLLLETRALMRAKFQRFRRGSWPLHQPQPTAGKREPEVARDAQEVYPWRQRLRYLLFRPSMLLVLHPQDLV